MDNEEQIENYKYNKKLSLDTRNKVFNFEVDNSFYTENDEDSSVFYYYF